MVFWNFGFALKRISHNKRIFVSGIAPSIILVASLISIIMTSSLVFSATVSEYDSDIAMDYFVTLNDPPSDDDLSLLKQNIEISTECTAEKYAVIRKTRNDMSFALCAIESNSSLWDYIQMQNLTRPLSANESILVVNDGTLPRLSINQYFSFTESFTLSNGSYDYIRIQTKIVDYASSTLRPDSLTGQLSSHAGMFIDLPPDVILFCDYDNTIKPIIQYIDTIGTPDIHSLFSGLSIRLDRDTLVREIQTETYFEHLENLQDSIEETLTEYGNHRIYSNVEGAIVVINGLVNVLSFQMLGNSIYLFSIVLIIAVVIRGKSIGLISNDNDILHFRGISEKRLQRQQFFENGIAAILSTICGYFLALISVGIMMNITLTTLIDLIISNSVYSLILGLIVSFLFFHGISYTNRNRSEDKIETSDEVRLKGRFQYLLMILGIYKIMLWIFGISISKIVVEGGDYLPNIVYSLLGILVLIDIPLNYLGPIFFIYGFSIIISSSRRIISTFERITNKIIGIIGQIGSASLKKYRIHRFILVIVLITSYITFASSSYDSQIDYYDRLKRSEAGSDISAILPSDVNVTSVTNSLQEISHIDQYTFEHSFPLVMNGWSCKTHAVDFSAWLDVTYWEQEWFNTQGSESALPTLLENTSSIILEKRVALRLGVDIGDSIEVQPRYRTNESDTDSMLVVGLFGPDPSVRAASGGYEYYQVESTYSIVSDNHPELINQSDTITRILIEIDTDDNVGGVVNELKNLSLFITSFSGSNLDEYDIGQIAQSSISTISIAYALLLSTLGIGSLVNDVIIERKRELAALRLRGVSKRIVQVLILSEILPVLFAAVFGILIGSIETMGVITTSYSNLTPALVSSRFIVGQYFIYLTLLSISLIVVSILSIVFLRRDFLTTKSLKYL
ncbi:MAG: hypothetical protein RTV31_13660, partial [Candidatus Thorarchaeota archaeon]